MRQCRRDRHPPQLRPLFVTDRQRRCNHAATIQNAPLIRRRTTSQIPTPVARRIVAMQESGQSYGAIARALTDEQVLSPAGRPTWQASTVRRFCKSVELAKAGA
ncbi:recombinase family protein [Rhodococcus sp. USK10]|uniref:recombinase family protein n=1 Tax=Rhodococcus sp. USK10 TaxID=2789739 RepID=UPI0035B55902